MEYLTSFNQYRDIFYTLLYYRKCCKGYYSIGAAEVNVIVMENYCLVSNHEFGAIFGSHSLQFDELLSVAFLINGFIQF